MDAIKHMLTGVDNQTYDVGRLCLVLGVLAFISLSIYAVLTGTKWDPQTFGIGFGSVMAGGGANLLMKKDTEPPAQAKP